MRYSDPPPLPELCPQGEAEPSAAPLRSVVSSSIVLGLLAILLSAAVLGTLDTNLPYRLQECLNLLMYQCTDRCPLVCLNNVYI